MYNHHGHIDQYGPDTTRRHAHPQVRPSGPTGETEKDMLNFGMGIKASQAHSTIFQAELVTRPVVHLTEPAHSQRRDAHGK